MPKTIIEVKNPEDMPKTDHWAIIEFVTYTESDGYGGTYQTPMVTYTAYLVEDEWKLMMRERTLGRGIADKWRNKGFTGIFVNVAKTKIDTAFTF